MKLHKPNDMELHICTVKNSYKCSKQVTTLSSEVV